MSAPAETVVDAEILVEFGGGVFGRARRGVLRYGNELKP
jgi:hypothetical protein